jgi:hypothetical protein
MIDQRGIVERHARAERIALIAESHARLTGRSLAASGADLWMLPAVVVAHGAEPDPVFFYGNRPAQTLFEFPAGEFVQLPSRLSAERAEQEARAAFMARVATGGFVSDYSGVRVSARGQRFRIERATVWNLTDADGTLHGQAAVFSHWTLL